MEKILTKTIGCLEKDELVVWAGIIGNRQKKGMIFEQLLREGLDPSWLDSVHAPIGLAIQAETPAEIAVSILAEMIQVRVLGRKSNIRT